MALTLPEDELDDDELLEELLDEELELDEELLLEEELLLDEALLEEDEPPPVPPQAANISNATLRGTNFLYIGSPRLLFRDPFCSDHICRDYLPGDTAISLL